MQDNSRGEPHTGSSEFRLKVAIPRLTHIETQPPQLRNKHRGRVPRACRNCHRRKVKCSGELPQCNFCAKFSKPCVYETTRRDRLAKTNDRNESLIALLKELSSRVDAEDRSRIESALNDDTEDEDDSLESSSAGGYARPILSNIQQSTRSRHHSLSLASPSKASYTSDANISSSLMNQAYDIATSADDILTTLEAYELGHLGQECEVQWLRDLKVRLQKETNTARAVPVPSLNDTNFYLDSGGMQILHQQNPFYLPPESLANVLSRYYFQTVHVTFPIISLDIEQQLNDYYLATRRAESVPYPQRWFSIVYLVFAIGASFSRQIKSEWQVGPQDETIYFSRACQLLDLNAMMMALTLPDLLSIQASGLLAFYYLSKGHIKKAWAMAGTAVHGAIALGLQAQTRSSSADRKESEMMSQTWWSLHNLDSLISSMIGRPSMLRSEDITTPYPSKVIEAGQQQNAMDSPAIFFSDVQVRLAVITQEISSLLYTRRRTPPSWSQTHAIITSLTAELDEWVQDAMPQRQEGTHTLLNLDMEEVMVQKQYCRAKILITRPALRRLEKLFEAESDDLTPFDHEVAKTCVQTALDVASLLPSEVDLKLVHERGPWWTFVHNIMQSLSILLISIYFRPYFESSYATSVAGVTKLVTWLQYMRDTNDMAERAYAVVHSIVKPCEGAMWVDIAGLFPEEYVLPSTRAVAAAQGYVHWASEEQPPLPWLFEYGVSGDLGNNAFGGVGWEK